MQLPTAEKLQIIEALWSDLAADDTSYTSPAWHGKELDLTVAEFEAGKVETLDWEEAKKRTPQTIGMKVRILRTALEDLEGRPPILRPARRRSWSLSLRQPIRR